MCCEERSGWIEYRSERTHRGTPPTRLDAIYRGIGATFCAKPGSLEEFLIERYCLYSVTPKGQLLRGEIHHPPWELQLAEADFTENSMANPITKEIAGRPLLHFSRRQDVVAWAPETA